MRKTRAGIDWTRDYRFGAAKILVGHQMFQSGTPDFTRVNERRMEQLVGDRMPEVLEALYQNYDGGNSIGYLLTHRASYCLNSEQYKHGKNELLRFQKPDFASTWKAVTQTDEKLSLLRLLDIQEQRIILMTPEGPGLYLRHNPDSPAYIYVGDSGDLPSRNSGHGNSLLYLWECYATATYADAHKIQNATLNYLKEIGEPWRELGKGGYRVHGCNAVDLVHAFLMKYYREFFKNIVGAMR
jgi:hypothetical protein